MNLSQRQRDAIGLAIGVLMENPTLHEHAIDSLRGLLVDDGFVFLLTYGGGSSRGEWGVRSIHATWERAEEEESKPRASWDRLNIEEWRLE